ncbi:hypothetical protein [Halorussus sp. MSC15.2]|uniref:hypothetical protein n=1 Tax=Halorussus sp. MSC15.2 TaxID=2283638 RepID=UPI0013D02E75|nr:hypothetical protein [Halorussus sp. MSC15.2]NEU58266.1 hypothetical protein [Halorussus sp. MSC15.2]
MEKEIGRRFERRLDEEFGGDAGTRRVVARQARDLADSGQFETDVDRQLTAPVVVENLRDAPDDLALAEKWNWWMGALELAYGGYDRFRVVRWAGGPE